MAFSPNGREFTSGHDATVLKVWDTATGIARDILHDHSGPIRAVAFAPNGQILASGSGDKTIRLWVKKNEINWESS